MLDALDSFCIYQPFLSLATSCIGKIKPVVLHRILQFSDGMGGLSLTYMILNISLRRGSLTLNIGHIVIGCTMNDDVIDALSQGNDEVQEQGRREE